jgi:hypothetical protein
LCFNDIGEDAANNYAREEVRNKELAMHNHNTYNKKTLCPKQKHPKKKDTQLEKHVCTKHQAKINKLPPCANTRNKTK